MGSSTEGLPKENMKVVLVFVSIVALCHAQSIPSAPKDWPSNWVMFGHNECQASQRDVSYVLYSVSGDQVRSDVNVIMDMAQNMTYYNFDTSVNKNQTVEVFVASSYAGEAKCVSEKMGENGHPGKGITPDWAAGSKWIGQSSIDEVPDQRRVRVLCAVRGGRGTAQAVADGHHRRRREAELGSGGYCWHHSSSAQPCSSRSCDQRVQLQEHDEPVLLC